MTARPVTAFLIALSLFGPAPAFARGGEGAASARHARVAKVERAGKEAPARVEENARAEMKAAVAEARENRPRGRIWCVPFARRVSGIEIKGNAVTWWNQAGARYQRGSEPQVGAVMNFRATRKMPMGHVAVVSQVVDERRILIDQANWERNRITEDTLVVDISARNDWSKVRVENAAGSLGAPYPVFGFIYR